MSPTAADLEKQIIVAIEFLKRGFKSFSLPDFGVTVGKYADGTYGIVSFAATEAPDPAAEIAALDPGLNGATTLAEAAQLFADGKLPQLNALLAESGLVINRLEETSDAEEGPAGADS